MKAKLSLSETERALAHKFVRQGKANARTLTRAWILLKLADGWDEAQVAETFAVTQATVKNVAQRFAEGGLDLVLHDKLQQRRRHALTGKPPAHLIAITCSPAPDGHDRLPGALTRQQSGGTGLCREDFSQHHPPPAQKNELKPWRHEHWCLPTVGGEFVAAMEDVLDLNAGGI